MTCVCIMNIVEDSVKKLTCDDLIKALRKEIPDERYKADLKILEGTFNMLLRIRIVITLSLNLSNFA